MRRRAALRPRHAADDVNALLVTGAINSSFWPYYARNHSPWPITDTSVTAPTAYAALPKEILHPPARLGVARYTTDLRRWTDMKAGGTSPRSKSPSTAADIRAFLRTLR